MFNIKKKLSSTGMCPQYGNLHEFSNTFLVVSSKRANKVAGPCSSTCKRGLAHQGEAKDGLTWKHTYNIFQQS